mmetsp:Transcript_38732/g.124164  ORF Transcript_38732/g.124164 Transcript_38732/m.124164 type:complete len:109 (+) Transcript_38732:156-482(+)
MDEKHNDEQLDALSEQVAMLKNLTKEIDTEVKDQNSFLDKMEAGFHGAGEALGRTMRELDAMGRRGGTRLALFLIVAIVAAFLLVYWATTTTEPAAKAKGPNPVRLRR